jgi:hypothetical protein
MTVCKRAGLLQIKLSRRSASIFSQSPASAKNHFFRRCEFSSGRNTESDCRYLFIYLFIPRAWSPRAMAYLERKHKKQGASTKEITGKTKTKQHNKRNIAIHYSRRHRHLHSSLLCCCKEIRNRILHHSFPGLYSSVKGVRSQ